ncbi:MAG: GNAT family N-acetyltransferase [Crocinitomicaceae bacterium]|nr:GNAT family N-acetyltransferase [Crocinitomicaceae bacterium]
MISGRFIYLRPVTQEDAEQILEWENDPEFWPITETPGPFVIQDIRRFIERSSDLFGYGQIRLVICTKREDHKIGMLDLFNLNTTRQSAGVGILVAENSYRNKGIATEAISILINSMYQFFYLKSLECLVFHDNTASIHLFEKCGFTIVESTVFKNKKAIRYIYNA